MGSRVPRRLLTTTLVNRLAEIEHVTVYLRRVGFVLGTPADVPPPTVSVSDLRVRPYLVVHPSPGSDGFDARLDSTRSGLVWQPQITCVAGDEEALDPLIDAVTAKTIGWRPVFLAPHASTDVGRFRSPDGYDPGPNARDDDITPARYWTPLLVRLPIYA